MLHPDIKIGRPPLCSLSPYSWMNVIHCEERMRWLSQQGRDEGAVTGHWGIMPHDDVLIHLLRYFTGFILVTWGVVFIHSQIHHTSHSHKGSLKMPGIRGIYSEQSMWSVDYFRIYEILQLQINHKTKRNQNSYN